MLQPRWIARGEAFALAAVIIISLLLQIGLIWLAHIAIDRAAGFGLRYPGDTRDNHLRRL